MQENLRTNRLRAWLVSAALAVSAVIVPKPRPCEAQQSCGTKEACNQRVREKETHSSVEDALRAGFSLYELSQYAQATRQFQRALLLAEREHDAAGEADAHRGLGEVFLKESRYGAAQGILEEALAEYQAEADSLGAARDLQALGTLARLKGDWKTARQLYQQSLSVFEHRHSLRDEASVLQALDGDPSLTPAEQELQIQDGLSLARQTHDEELQGDFLHDWADAIYVQGNYAQAIEKLDQARPCFRHSGDLFSLGRLLTSEGRIFRASGQPSQAIKFYKRGLRIQREIGDKIGAVQNLNALGIAYSQLGEQGRALWEYESGLALARQTGSPGVVNFMLGSLAGEYLTMRRYELAASLLRQVLAREKSSFLLFYRYSELSAAEYGLGQYQAALNAANEALRLRRDAPREALVNALFRRAQAEQKLGRNDEALADVNASLDTLEQIRSRLAPTDLMRRDFTDRNHRVYDLAIALYERQGSVRQALDVAETARAREFDDLLASRSARPNRGERKAAAAAFKLEAQNARSGASAPVAHKPAAIQLALRGGEIPGQRITSVPAAPARLESFVDWKPLTCAQMFQLASHLRSTILSYWVTSDITYIWVVRPDDGIYSVPVAVSSERLKRLIAEVWPKPLLEPVGAGRGARSGEELTFNSHDKQDWRRLDEFLIQPIEKYLPSSEGSLLTIEPHGPLLQLPFAALIGQHGRYLIERYRLDYTPSLSLFRLTERPEKEADSLPPRFILVADPADLPPLAGGKFLSALPGARREVSAIARLVPANEVTMLVGGLAQERLVDSQLPAATVIHFATHAIMNNEHPSKSYLALGMNGHEGGRLTTDDVYGLNLHASLVFLSSCRTGMGKVSSDGIIGLTRAFFYAGTASVIASLWDVSDQTTERLVPTFYRYWLANHDKSKALREAQLHLLRDLRAGRVRVRTPEGTFILPEDPVLWSSFILEGEPR